MQGHNINWHFQGYHLEQQKEGEKLPWWSEPALVEAEMLEHPRLCGRGGGCRRVEQTFTGLRPVVDYILLALSSRATIAKKMPCRGEASLPEVSSGI